MKNLCWICCLAATTLLAASSAARADAKSKAAQEAAEYVVQRFGRQAAVFLVFQEEQNAAQVGGCTFQD